MRYTVSKDVWYRVDHETTRLYDRKRAAMFSGNRMMGLILRHFSRGGSLESLPQSLAAEYGGGVDADALRARLEPILDQLVKNEVLERAGG